MGSTRDMEPKRNNRLDPDAWVQAALAVLQERGIDHVRVERLARQLGVTKGSFYWHFRDRQDLLDHVIKYWCREMTETVFEVAHRFQGEPRARVQAVLEEVITHERTHYDLALRAWARSDAKAAAAVRDIDSQRQGFLEQLLADCGLEAADAARRAQLLYDFILGDGLCSNRPPRARRLETMRDALEIVLGAPAGPPSHRP